MANTAAAVSKIDRLIAAGRRSYLAAYFAGARVDAEKYAAEVDELLDLRNRAQRGES